MKRVSGSIAFQAVNLVIVVTSSLLISCEMIEFSPWESKVPDDLTDFNAKELSDLRGSDPGIFEPFKVALLADIHGYYDNFEKTIRRINERDDIDFAFVLGDFADNGLLNEYVWYAEAIKSFDIPIITVVGNHDAISNGKQIYRDMFGQTNFTFDYKEITFIIWNNNRFEYGNPDFDWLRQQLNEHENSIVVAHQPPDCETLTDEQSIAWEHLRRHPHYIASIGAHTHHFSLKIEDDGLPVFVQEAIMEGPHYGVMTVNEETVSFDYCRSDCYFVGEGTK